VVIEVMLCLTSFNKFHKKKKGRRFNTWYQLHTFSVSQHSSFFRKLHIQRNQINFVIFDEIMCFFYYFIMFWTGQKTNRTLTCGRTCTALRLCTQRSTPASVHLVTQERALMQGSPYTCPASPLITCRITRRRLWPTRAYIRVNLLHPQGTHHFSQHFLHTFSQFHFWLERQSANVPADTFRPTAKTHRRFAGSSYRHTGAFSVVVATQPFSPDKSHSIISLFTINKQEYYWQTNN